MCHKEFKSPRTPTKNELTIRLKTVRDHFGLHDTIESRQFDCKLCDRKFSREPMLKNHLLFHALSKKKAEKKRELTECPVCQKRYSLVF